MDVNYRLNNHRVKLDDWRQLTSNLHWFADRGSRMNSTTSTFNNAPQLSVRDIVVVHQVTAMFELDPTNLETTSLPHGRQKHAAGIVIGTF